MNKLKIAIGFVTGRNNVCDIINNTHKDIIKQFSSIDKEIEPTIYILYDLNYVGTKREEFYKLDKEVYKEFNVKYITPEDIIEEKKKIRANNEINKEDLDLFFGHGHAKGRNTVMYYAKKDGMDSLLFWDDDEYPVACVKTQNQVKWIEQDNVVEHLKNIDVADITIGHHCGYISPIPYFEFGEEIDEEKFKKYIEAISNEVIEWDSIKEKFIKDNGITYANTDIIENKKIYEIEYNGLAKWVVGSTICLNLRNIDKIPAYYNPQGARGEDAFFSTWLKDTKVLKLPIYHFHDGFLKYKNILKKAYPQNLRKIKVDEEWIPQRFIQASRGWMKYKPLLLYITNSETFNDKIEEIRRELDESIPELNKLFVNYDFSVLKQDLENYQKDVEIHYSEYIKTHEIWENLKKIIK